MRSELSVRDRIYQVDLAPQLTKPLVNSRIVAGAQTAIEPVQKLLAYRAFSGAFVRSVKPRYCAPRRDGKLTKQAGGVDLRVCNKGASRSLCQDLYEIA